MQELRFVLIAVGGLAIAALLFHGFWTSKKEGKAKFGDKPLGKLEDEAADAHPPLPEDDYEIIVKDKTEPDLRNDDNMFGTKLNTDPLLDSHEPFAESASRAEGKDPLSDMPSFSALDKEQITDHKVEAESTSTVDTDSRSSAHTETSANMQETEAIDGESIEAEKPTVVEEKPAPEVEVIVLGVHCAGDEAFVGTALFDSMLRHGLTFGEMNIFHCFSEPNAQGKVLFSVANMMHPGTLEHTDPATFSTKGISFFMTLPGFGESDQNFNTMLRTAQEIANDLGGNVVDDQRNLMTPDRLGAYRRQIVEFNAANG